MSVKSRSLRNFPICFSFLFMRILSSQKRLRACVVEMNNSLHVATLLAPGTRKFFSSKVDRQLFPAQNLTLEHSPNFKYRFDFQLYKQYLEAKLLPLTRSPAASEARQIKWEFPQQNRTQNSWCNLGLDQLYPEPKCLDLKLLGYEIHLARLSMACLCLEIGILKVTKTRGLVVQQQ